MKIKQQYKNYLKENVSLARTNALFFPFMLLLIGLSTLLTIYIGGKEAIAGNITTGNIAEFIIYVNMLTWPMASIGWVTSIIQRADASQKRINEFLKTEPEIVNQNNSNSLTYLVGSEFINFDKNNKNNLIVFIGHHHDKLRKTKITGYYTKSFKEYIYLLKIIIFLIVLMIPILILTMGEWFLLG